MSIVLVEVCDLNSICNAPLDALEEEYPGVSVLVTSCLGLCELCAEGPYAFVNGRLLVEDTVEAALGAVRHAIEEELRAHLED